jgi:renalase
VVDFKALQVAVVGAGVAGAACAHALTRAGHSVHVFDKSRGPGGRMATRRMEWVDRAGQAWTTPLDHGAIGFTAHSTAFRRFVEQAERAGWLAPWTPAQAVGSLPAEDGAQLHVPLPDMPSLCRRLLEGVTATWSFAVDGLHRPLRGSLGWQVTSGGDRHPLHFDAVVLALPLAQAAPLLGPHRRDWARHASIVTTQPCWTLMGVASAPADEACTAPGWELARPPAGPLACVLRNDARPGRARVSGQAHWVAHARSGWSRRHLEQPADWVRQQMQAALAQCLGRPIDWQHCVVHRWRYAMPSPRRLAAAEWCLWDADLGLGVCGDGLGGSGVEGAWLSAQALCSALLRPGASEPDAADAVAAATRRLAA